MNTRPAAASSPRSRGHRQRERTLNRILDAARQVFVRKGVDRTVITDIRDAAGISQGTFYNYFWTKEDVLQALDVRVTQEYQQTILQVSSQYTDPAERLARAARQWLRLAHERPDLTDLVIAAGNRLSGLHGQVGRELMVDLEAGARSGRFAVSANETTLDILRALGLSGIRLVREGKAGPGFEAIFIALMMRALGIAPDEAEAIAARVLTDAPACGRRRSARR